MVMRWLTLLAALCSVAGCGAPSWQRHREASAASAGALDYLDPASDRQAEAHARYANAVLLDLNAQSREAAAEFLQAALADPGNETLVLEVSRRLLHEKMYAEAVGLLERAVDAEGASGSLYARLGLAYALHGQKDRALRANRLAIRKAPKDLQGYRHLAQMRVQEGNGPAALEVLDEAAAQDAVDLSFLLELAGLYVALGKAARLEEDLWKPKAVEVLDRARAVTPRNPLFLQKMAETYHAVGEEERARELYVELLEQLPELPEVREKLIEIYLRRHETDRAVPLLERLVKESPTNPQAHYFLGVIALENEQAEEAVEHLGRALLLKDDLEPAYYDLAGAYLGLNRPQKALDTLAEARRRFQQKFVLEYYSGVAYNQLEDHAAALKHFTAAEVVARATEPERLTHLFYFQLGAISERNEQYTEAERYFRLCLKKEPEFAQALNYLGYMWADRGVNLEEARTMIEKAVALEPDNAAYLDSLAWVLFKQGEAEQALEQMQRAIEKSTQPDPTLYDHLGDIQMKLKEVDKARQAWKKSLELEPNEAIQKKLDAAGDCT